MTNCSTHREFDDCCPGCLRIALAASNAHCGLVIRERDDAEAKAKAMGMDARDSWLQHMEWYRIATAAQARVKALESALGRIAELGLTLNWFGDTAAEDASAVATAALSDTLPTREEGEETVKRLGIDVPKWAAEIRAKVAAVATPIPPVPVGAPGLSNPLSEVMAGWLLNAANFLEDDGGFPEASKYIRAHAANLLAARTGDQESGDAGAHSLTKAEQQSVAATVSAHLEAHHEAGLHSPRPDLNCPRCRPPTNQEPTR